MLYWLQSFRFEVEVGRNYFDIDMFFPILLISMA